MRLNKYIKLFCSVTMLSVATIFSPITTNAAPANYELPAMEESLSGKSEQKPKIVEKEMTLEEAIQEYSATGYKYTSERYGYSIICPQKPVGVIPLSTMVESERGDVLIFENEGYNLKHAWIIMINAFTDKELPNLDSLSEEKQALLIDDLMNTAGYEFVRIADINGRKGLYAVTAKIIDVDTNGDGKPDEVLEADTQMIKTFFIGQFGGRFSVQLIDNPELTPFGVQTYQLGICTFQEWPTKMQNGKNTVKN